jgi:protein ImuB
MVTEEKSGKTFFWRFAVTLSNRIICVRLTHWPIDRILRRQPKLRLDPLALIQTVASRQIVADRCPRAAARGVRIGMTLAEARALCPGLRDLPHEPQRDLHQLLALGRWLIRYAPIVSPSPPDAIFLDCTGCRRLYGSWSVLIARVAAAMRHLNLRARLAIAPTPGAAWAVAACGIDQSIVAPETLAETLAPFPVAALRIDPHCAALLRELGVETIGQLRHLPRQSLPARFGSDLLQKLDAALGEIPEPLNPLPHHGPIAAFIRFPAPIENLEILQQAIRLLVGGLIDQLARRGCGARSLQIEFRQAHAAPVVKTLRLAFPSRQARAILNLLRCVLETVGSEEGFIAVALSAPVFEPLADAQLSLLDQELQIAGDELARLIEMLSARLGPQAIVQPELVESHLPERSFRRVEPTIDPGGNSAAATVLPLVRPLHLLPRPSPIAAVVRPCDDGVGMPVAFTYHGEVFRLRHADGPERIAGLWWEGGDKTRDYFDVEDETGRRFWLFRVLPTGHWYLHGLFA